MYSLGKSWFERLKILWNDNYGDCRRSMSLKPTDHAPLIATSILVHIYLILRMTIVNFSGKNTV
jgi:hypothetical protein